MNIIMDINVFGINVEQDENNLPFLHKDGSALVKLIVYCIEAIFNIEILIIHLYIFMKDLIVMHFHYDLLDGHRI